VSHTHRFSNKILMRYKYRIFLSVWTGIFDSDSIESDYSKFAVLTCPSLFLGNAEALNTTLSIVVPQLTNMYWHAVCKMQSSFSAVTYWRKMPLSFIAAQNGNLRFYTVVKIYTVVDTKQQVISQKAYGDVDKTNRLQCYVKVKDT